MSSTLSNTPDIDIAKGNNDDIVTESHNPSVYNLNLCVDNSVANMDTAQIQHYLGTVADVAFTEMLHRLDAGANQINQTKGMIGAFVNGAGLACPMPLLKTKVALRNLPDDKALYVIATDPHSQADIKAFCQQTGYSLLLNTVSNVDADTIFHFIITKTDSN